MRLFVFCMCACGLSLALLSASAQAGPAAAGDAGCACCARDGAGQAADRADVVAQAKAKEMVEQPFALTPCPECGKVGGLCEHCKAYATEFLSKLAGAVCPDCEYPDICDRCKQAVALGLEELPKIEATQVQVPAHDLAYEAGKFSDDRGALITKVVTDASAQGLVGDHTMVGSLYPDVMVNMVSNDTPVYACISFDEGATIAEPLKTVTVPAGPYMKVVHHGSYESIGVSWMTAFCFADMNGIALGSGPAGEMYVSDPGTTPEDQLITWIFIPLTGETATATAASS